ncbi:transposase [Deinococcus sp. KNUC1210]|uniref:transposase n=1 Tax=Deinococcus sp. KNUC1210 TaxID=2917691 RepID=UPI001EF031FD|nr:transposase [Deinococcus sp. KNUC1210]ULH15499.1 transposase [Deinococcus sp. KNUC1210]
MNKNVKNSTIELAVRLYPDAPGETRLLKAAGVVREVQRAVGRYLLAVTAGQAGSLIDAATSVSDPAPSTRSGAAPRVTQEMLLRQLQDARVPLGWHHALPASSVRLAGLEMLSLYQQGKPEPTWTNSWIPLNGGVWPINPFQVMVHALGPDAVQACDLFALPDVYRAALSRRQQRHMLGEARRFAAARAAFLSGDRLAFSECQRIARRLPPLDLDALDATESEDTPDLASCRERAYIRRVLQPWCVWEWELVLTFRVAGNLPQAWISDTAGVDVGADNLLAWASGSEQGLLDQKFIEVPLPQGPALPDDLGPVPLNHALGEAQARKILFDALRPGYEAVIRQLLRYRRIALENLDWSSFRGYDFRFDLFARDAYLHTALAWLEAYAPLHGSRIVRVDPHYTSRTCSRCRPDWVNPTRPVRGQPFRCQRCGHVQVSDINASLVTRRRSLTDGGEV